MKKFIYLLSGCLTILLSIAACSPAAARLGMRYCINVNGNDSSAGDLQHPFQSIRRLNQLHLIPGDTIFFTSGQTFAGNLLLDASSGGTPQNPVVIASTGNLPAVINGGMLAAITLSHTAYIKLLHINCLGAGRKTGNTQDGISIIYCNHITIQEVNSSGFQKAGLLVYASDFIEAANVHAHDNGFAGIAVSGDSGKRQCMHIQLHHCSAVNNAGDPSNLYNHSGNGIIIGRCTDVLIDGCMATNNGWDMPRTGNGPVGIWAWEADSVIIQHCLSFRNKTSAGGGMAAVLTSTAALQIPLSSIVSVMKMKAAVMAFFSMRAPATGTTIPSGFASATMMERYLLPAQAFLSGTVLATINSFKIVSFTTMWCLMNTPLLSGMIR